ncbi:hypothetical protein KA183_19100 [bacterium]|nr:hypothetical protein [bacterium]
MRTVTVKEAADALGLTPRAIVARLSKGDLKGRQQTNAYGTKEWRIFPTKEIAQKMKLDHDSNVRENDFPTLEDPIDAETIIDDGNSSSHQDWIAEERTRMQEMAKEMLGPLAKEIMAPLLETIRAQERQILDQSRQLKLLPDFEKQAEEERKAAHLKAVEAAALSKQIEALKAETVEAKKAKEQVTFLEETLAARQRETDAEIEKLKAEKEAELKVVSDQLTALSQSLNEMKKPWWKKFLGISAEPETKPSSTEEVQS